MARGRGRRAGRSRAPPRVPIFTNQLSSKKQPYVPIEGLGLTTAQLRGEETASITRTQRRRAQRAGVSGRIAMVNQGKNEISLVTDLRKTINKLTGKPSGASRSSASYRHSSNDTENSEFETKREAIMHTKTRPEDVPVEEKKLWNARKPSMVRRAQQKQLTEKNTSLNATANKPIALSTRRRSAASSHHSTAPSEQHSNHSILRHSKRRNTSNELLMSDIEDEHEYYGSRHSRPAPPAKRDVPKEEDVRETDILGKPPVTRRRASTMLTRYSVQNETVAVREPDPEPEVILPPPKNLPPADITDGSIVAFHEAGIASGNTFRPAHSKTLIAKATRHIYTQ